MFTYTRAIVPAPGDPVSSRVYASQARAMNDRVKLGPSVPWRIVWSLFQAFRQIRNPDSSGFLFPTQAEFFEVFQMLAKNSAEYPATGPGDPEGANLASAMPAFVYGNATAGVDSEDLRISDPGSGGIDMDAGGGSPEELWTLAKRQRGAIDPLTGGMGAPALTAAASHSYLRQNPTSATAAACWGDYLPGPEYLGQCGAPYDTTASYTVQFTKLDGSLTVRSYGTCPSNPGDALGVVSTPFANVVFKFNGTVDVLRKKLWLEGPYTSNPSLRKTDSGFYDRALNAFIREFRGTDSQRATGGWGDAAFRVQEVLTTQYHLSPQRGIEVGPYVAPRYPRWEITGAAGWLPAGTMIKNTVGGLGSWYNVSPGFVCASAFVRVKKLVGVLNVEVLKGGDVLGVITITPAADGSGAAILTFDRPSEGGQFGFRLASSAGFDTAGEIRCEITELMAYQPSLADLYLILRCGGVIGGDWVDGSGDSCEFSREIGDAYQSEGVIRSQLGHVALPGTLGPINSNAVFDAARRLSQSVRMMAAPQLAGYAIENGNSVLWFNRYSYGLSHATPVDLFEGIAPSRFQVGSGAIVWGRKYIVQGTAGQAVTYAGRMFGVGQTFVGRSDTAEFTGAGQVWEADGIRATAEPQGWSNRWLLGVQLLPYKDNPASIYKPEAFSDYLGMMDRCVFGDPAIALDKVVVKHVAFGNRMISPAAVLTPEIPESFRYMPTPLALSAGGRANRALCTVGDTVCEGARRDFYRSCRVFEPWPEVQSVVMDGDLVKVTLQGRVHHHSGAPGTIARDPSTWDVSALRAESYRTWENGLREKIVKDTTGTNASIKLGDESWNSPIQSQPDRPWGAAWPHFNFVRLVPEPWLDGNDDGDDSDTPMGSDIFPMLDLYIRAACEGFIDGQTSVTNSCAYGSVGLYSFTFENLCFQASGGRWFSTLGTGPTSEVGKEETRADKPQGFGPLQWTMPFAEVAAGFSKALNLLTEFRVMVPASLQMRTGSGLQQIGGVVVRNGANVFAGPGTWEAGAGSGSDFAILYEGPFPAPGITTWSAWADSALEIVTSGGGIDLVGSTPILSGNTGQIQYRWESIGDAIYALPDQFADMLEGAPVVVAQIVRDVSVVRRYLTSGIFSGRQCHPTGNPADFAWSDGSSMGNVFDSIAVVHSVECLVLRSGSVSPTPVAPGIAAAVDSVGDPNPLNRCYDGPSSSVALSVAATDSPAITVGLIDFVESSVISPP